MPKATTSDQEFMAVFDAVGATKAAALLGVQEHNIYKRRRRLEKTHGRITAPTKQAATKEYPHRALLEVKNGIVIVGSDLHIWPGAESTALRAFKRLCKDLKPSAVILNGDVLDFPQISRHPPIGWESAEADAIALLPGWRNSKGATAEHAAADALGLKVIEL